LTYTYQTSFTLRLSGLDCGDHHVPLEIVYTVRPGSEATSEQPAEEATVGISKVTLTGKDGTRYRAHDWLWEILVGDKDLGDELIAEANAADEAAADAHGDAMRSRLRV
jgi:hypothetical protein